jgi:Putative transposase of IS4/5 family (DUF4096)
MAKMMKPKTSPRIAAPLMICQHAGGDTDTDAREGGPDQEMDDHGAFWQEPACRTPSQPDGDKYSEHSDEDRRRADPGGGPEVRFRLSNGCQWNRLPAAFGDDSTVHRHFQHWCQAGIFARRWAVLVEACDELHGVDWQWQAADTAMGKARMGGDLVGRNPTDRGKKG